MNVTNRLKINCAALVVAVFAVPQMVYADTSSTHQKTATAHVNYADLNLTSEAGKEALYYRISSASRAVCGDQKSLTGAGSLKQLMLNQQCYDAAMAKAYAEVKHAGVANLNN